MLLISLGLSVVPLTRGPSTYQPITRNKHGQGHVQARPPLVQRDGDFFANIRASLVRYPHHQVAPFLALRLGKPLKVFVIFDDIIQQAFFMIYIDTHRHNLNVDEQ